MPRRLFACTPSRLAAFDCPRRYRMTYLDRPTPAPRRALGAQHARRSRTPRAAPLVAAAPRASARRRSEGCARRAQLAVRRLPRRGAVASVARPGGQWVEQLSRRTSTRTTSRSASSAPLPRHDERLAVSGRVDRIDDRGGELVIVDYKTGRQVPDADDARWLAGAGPLRPRRAAHVAARRAAGSSCTICRPATSPRTSTPMSRWPGTSPAPRREPTTSSPRPTRWQPAPHPDDVFPPAPSPACSWCDFRAHCPEGQAASPVRHWSLGGARRAEPRSARARAGSRALAAR